MGVYGMLALSLATFPRRNIVRPEFWKEKRMMTGFCGLNAGLMGMILITLFPIGALQAIESFNNGFWSARSSEFYRQPMISTPLWLRMIPDAVLIAIGVLPIIAAALYAFLPRPTTGESAMNAPVVELVEADEPAFELVHRSAHAVPGRAILSASLDHGQNRGAGPDGTVWGTSGNGTATPR
jgi:hypothetical protein